MSRIRDEVKKEKGNERRVTGLCMIYNVWGQWALVKSCEIKNFTTKTSICNGFSPWIVTNSCILHFNIYKTETLRKIPLDFREIYLVQLCICMKKLIYINIFLTCTDLVEDLLLVKTYICVGIIIHLILHFWIYSLLCTDISYSIDYFGLADWPCILHFNLMLYFTIMHYCLMCKMFLLLFCYWLLFKVV